MSLDKSKLDGVMEKAVKLFTQTTLKLFPTINEMLKDAGFEQKFIDTVFSLGKVPSQKDIEIIGPVYFQYNILRRYKSFRQYPLQYVKSELKNVKPMEPVVTDIYETNGIYYSMKPAEKNILILRPDEIFTGTTRLQKLLGPANDGRYNVLEVIGMYHQLELGVLPDKFMDEVWAPNVQQSRSGEELRKRIKPYTTSIKRWPEYWEEVFQVNSSLIAETETALGYIIKEELDDSHLESVASTLSVTPVRFAGTEAEFWSSIKLIIDLWPVHKPKDIDFELYLNSWHLWTTSGSAPEFRVKTKDGQTLRVNKSALPLVITKEELLSSKNDWNRVIQKAEVGKNRIAYSTPTLNTLQEGYIVYKYSLEDNPSMFTSLSNAEKFTWSANIVGSKNKYASSDIEQNDFIHSTYLDTYIMGYLLYNRLSTQEDINIVVEILERNLINKVLVKHEMTPIWAPFLERDRGLSVLLSGSGGIMSGRRWTTLLNSIVNFLINTLAVTNVRKLSLGYPSRNTFGGDDSIQVVDTLRSGILIFILETAMFLTINPTKSYISDTTGEFFRVQYKIGEYRSGYYSRVIHSIVSNNPVSMQEIDAVTKCKAFWANCQQILRRTMNKGSAYLQKLMSILASIAGVRNTLTIAPSNGGCGISPQNIISTSIATPGIPRFTQTKKVEDYKLNYKWFDQCMSVVDPGLPGIRESYIQDMLDGIRDIDSRVEQRKRYRLKLRLWSPRIIEQPPTSTPQRYSQSLLMNSNPITVTSKTIEHVNTKRTRQRAYFHVNKKYQLFIDVLSRAIFPRFKDKLEYLTSSGILWLNGSYRNTKSAYTLKSVMLKSLDTVGSMLSLPPDMNFIPNTEIVSMIGFQPVRSPSDYYRYCSTYWAASHSWLSKTSGWALSW